VAGGGSPSGAGKVTPKSAGKQRLTITISVHLTYPTATSRRRRWRDDDARRDGERQRLRFTERLPFASYCNGDDRRGYPIVIFSIGSGAVSGAEIVRGSRAVGGVYRAPAGPVTSAASDSVLDRRGAFPPTGTSATQAGSRRRKRETSPRLAHLVLG